MTFSLLKAQVLLKAAQHKYTHRKLVGRDPKTGRKRYRYYYAEHHGGGITSAEIEAGSAFKLTFKGRRGHFHVQSVEGDTVTVKHDGRPNSKPVEMTKAEFRALLKRQHETVENKKREKAQENRRRGRKKRKGSKRTKRKTAPQTQAPEQTSQVQDRPSALRDQAIKRDALEAVTQDSLNNLETQPFADLSDVGQKALDLEAGANALETEMKEASEAEKKQIRKQIKRARKLADQMFHYDRAHEMVRNTLIQRAKGEQVEIPRGNKKLQSAIDQVVSDLKERGSSWMFSEQTPQVQDPEQGADNFETMPEPDPSPAREQLTETAREVVQSKPKRKPRKKKRTVRVTALAEKASKEISEDIGSVGKIHANTDSEGIIQSVDRGQSNAHYEAAGAVKRALLNATDGLIDYYTIIGWEEDSLKNSIVQAVLDVYQPNKTEEQAQLELKRAIAERVIERLPRGIESLRDTPDYMKGAIRGKNRQIKERVKVLEAIVEDTNSALEELKKKGPVEVTAPEPTASELSDDDLRRELLRARAALDDQGTLIDEARRKRQRISDLRKKERALAERVNTLENESQRRTPEPQGRGAKVPSQSELDRAIEQVRALVEQNPALANRPEVAVLLGSPDKQEVVAKGLPDSEMVITLNGKTQNVAVKYKIIEAGDAIPSHDASAFFQRKDYPSDVQEREYHNARSGEQEKVILQAKNLNPLLLVNTNPDAMNGPPILDQNGIALGGNSRVMSVQRAYLAHPEKAQAYKDYLKKKASTFGLSQSDVDGFTSPLLVREYVVEDQGKENLSKIVRAMNEGLTQEFDLLAEGRNNATKLLGDNNTLRSLSVALRDAPDDTTLNTMLKTKGERFERVKRALFADGILTKRNASKYLSQATGTMNDVGVAMLKSTLLGYVVRDDRLMRAMSPTTVDTLTNAFGRLAVVGLDRDQAEALQDAVYVYNQVTNKSKDTGGITTKMTPKQRDARVNESMMRDQGFTFKEASGEDVADESINFEKIKDRVKDNPLSSAFLKILALNPTSGTLNRSMKEFVTLVDEDQGGTDLFGSATVDFTTAAKQIASKLANKHGAQDGLYKSLIGLNLLDLYKALRC